MKLSVILLLVSFMLQGCFSSVGVGGGIPIGNSGIATSSVQVGSDGRVHGNIGLGTAIRL